MGNDRVHAIDDPGIVPSLIEHPHVDTQHAGVEYRTVNGAFIR